MRTESIGADTIDDAAEQILRELQRSVGSRDNVFYFDGWDGLGASAVLRAVARRFTTTTTTSSPAGAGPEFEKVIHIDCSKWESRRALQRAVAEQLDLPATVMDMFDREDEEDDFRGVARGSRAELPVDREMYQHIQNRRLLVIFHNGSNEEIDLASLCGFPLSGYSTSKVLWTFQGRFRVIPRTKVDTAMKTAGTTDVFLSVLETSVFLSVLQTSGSTEHWSYLVLQEAADVVEACRVNTGSRGIIDQPAHVVKCFQYMLELCCKGIIDYDLNTHSANYLVCDSIIYQPQQGERNMDEGLWRSAQALQCEMSLDVDYHQYLPYPHLLSRFVESKPYWSSPNYGFINRIPADSGDVFQHCADKLCVLKLSHCTFDFQSPPFLCCHSLRFLWLDHCQDTKTSTEGAAQEDDIRQCFQRLWVLDVRYTDCDQILSAQMFALMTQLRELNVIGARGWDMGQLQGRLPNIRKLRVKNSGVRCSCPENDLFSKMNRMEHLDFSRNYSEGFGRITSLFGPGVSTNFSCLETVVIDGCYELQQISFSGCTNMKNLHLGGQMWNVNTLDISGTSVKTLDLSTTRIYYLDELYLLDCKKLCSILWPPEDNMKKEGLIKLCINTTQSAPISQSREEKVKRPTSTATARTAVLAPAATTLHGNRPSSEFDWHISVRDARLLESLKPIYSDSRNAYVEISSPPHPAVVVDGSTYEGVFKSTSSREQQLVVNLQRLPAPAVYADITVDNLLQASEGNDETLGIMSTRPCPDVPDLPEQRCYIHIQDQIKTKLHRGGEGAGTITVPRFLMKSSKILHVHDSLSSITLDEDSYSEWPELEWCRIERCPQLDFVFNNNESGVLSYQLRIFWASQLLKSRYISTSNDWRVFPHLTLLHLDFCPRLIHVLPLSWDFFYNDMDSLLLLETLEIAWCSDLREIFPFRIDKPNSKDFPRLKSIHLHELPSLQHICGVKMSAPNLETVKIRGCWSLRRLPNIGSSDKVVECDCEKEWWDRLEWDDCSQANNYRPIHPHHYKKTLLRGSVLR